MTESTEGTHYRVEPERIGRNHNVPAQEFVAVDVDDLAEQIHRMARRHLTSRFYETTVDLDAGKFYVEYGRFGIGTVTAVSA